MLLQANIGGFNGRLATVIGAVDVENQALYIERADRMVENRFDTAGLITNQPLEDFDYFFTEADFKQAFQDYRFYANSERLIMKPQAQRATPPLQVAKITENGTNFEIQSEITNEQMGVIALCFFARQTSNFQQALNGYDEHLGGIETFITI